MPMDVSGYAPRKKDCQKLTFLDSLFFISKTRALRIYLLKKLIVFYVLGGDELQGYDDRSVLTYARGNRACYDACVVMVEMLFYSLFYVFIFFLLYKMECKGSNFY